MDITKKGTRVGLYARVSTKEGRQHLENQLRELRAYAKRFGWKIAAEFYDEVSGKEEARPGLDDMFTAAAGKIFDIVLVWDLSRLTRNGPSSAFAAIDRLKLSGVELWSYREEFFRTPGAGQALIAICAWMAQQEREAISERVKAGLARVRASGKRLGRPRVVVDKSKVAELRAAGYSIRKAAARLKVHRSAIERVWNIQEVLAMVTPK